MNYQYIIEPTFSVCQGRRKKTSHRSSSQISNHTRHRDASRGKRALARLERQPYLRRTDSQATDRLGCTLTLLGVGKRNGPADRPLISQGSVGGIAEINMDYSSMTDTFRRAFFFCCCLTEWFGTCLNSTRDILIPWAVAAILAPLSWWQCQQGENLSNSTGICTWTLLGSICKFPAYVIFFLEACILNIL